MATHRIADRVLETTTSTGTGNITMAGAVTGYSTVDSACTVDGDTIDLVIGGGTQWEYVRLTRVSAGVYSRAATPWGSSSGGGAITFIAGVKEVWSDVGAFFAEHLNTVEIAIASAATCDIGALRGLRTEISGAVTITSFGISKNKLRFVRFSGAPLLTHNATSLILPGGVNITPVAGDTAIFASDSSGNWRCLSYCRGGFAIKAPTVQKFLSSSGTYTTPTGVKAIRVKMIGGGGGGGGGGASGVSTDGGAGGNTTFGTLTAGGGGGGGHSASSGGAAGTASGTADITVSGGGGSGGHQLAQGAGGAGGNGYLGGGGAGGVPGVAGGAGSTNTGGGGGGGSNNGGTASGGGGGSGGFVLSLITAPSATYAYAVGAAGTAGGAGTSGAAGGAGGSGGIWVEEFYA